MVSLSDFTIDTSGTAQDVQRRQKLADALMQQGSDSSPAAGGRNGGWITALNRGLAGALSGYQRGQADQISQGARQADQSLLASYPGMNPAASGTTPAMLQGAQAPASDTTGKIYNNDEPSPLDPPSGADRQKMLATILGEESTPQGQSGVANVIRNRAVDGSYGGDTPSAVVQSPNQFEPWNTPAGKARMAAALQNPGQVAAADNAIKGAYGEGGQAPNDPTEGKTMFYAPGAQAALGRPAPSWAQGEGQKLGQTMFYDDNSGTPANAQPAQGQLPTQVAQADPQAGRKQELMAWARNAAMSQNPSIRQMGIQTLESLQKQESYTQETDKDGNIWSVNKTTGQRTVAKAAEATPSSVREYEYYKENSPPGEKVMDYSTWSDKKARAAATNVNTNVDTRAETELSKTVGKAQGEVIGEDIKAGSHASNKLRQLATLDEANKHGGDDISSGPLGKAILSGKQGFSELTGIDLKGVPESEVIQKVGFGLATNMVKAITNRPSQMEFGKALENVPGLYMSRQGRVAMTSILTQEAQAEREIGRLANNPANHRDWQAVKDKYYEDHPLMSPFTGKPFGEADVQMLTKSAPGAEQSSGPVKVASPDEARKLPKGTKIILPDGSPGVVP